MNDFLEYKGFQGSVKYDKADGCLFGQVMHIDSLLMYHGESVGQITKAFIDTVDAYLEFCTKTNREPNKPYKGTFNVRVGPTVHRDAVVEAAKRGQSLNEFVGAAIANELAGNANSKREEKPINWAMANVAAVPGAPVMASAAVANQGSPNIDALVAQFRH